MRKIIVLLLVLTVLGVMSSAAYAANGTLWPPITPTGSAPTVAR